MLISTEDGLTVVLVNSEAPSETIDTSNIPPTHPPLDLAVNVLIANPKRVSLSPNRSCNYG